ncbi:hypothetical protein [Streptomyces bobili]|uniref:Uncharacterized protein n=1 Tax=Streptomyces bobili TaxID=67280 RepID=A0ABZ1R5J9_9ACTN|nr:hypothetical protein [Streptomyces bobili]
MTDPLTQVVVEQLLPDPVEGLQNGRGPARHPSTHHGWAVS